MRVSPNLLRDVATELLLAMDVQPDRAKIVADSLVRADLRGSGTQGLALLPLYASMIGDGAIEIDSEPIIETLSDCIGRVDGCKTFGQIVGKVAVNMGVEMTARHGVAVVGIKDASHLGRLGEWAESACANGLAFVALINTSGGAFNVSAPNVFKRILSTNPIVFGMPAFDANSSDMIVDIATSQVSGSMIRERFNAGQDLATDWTITTEGNSTVDPKLFMDGLSVLLHLGGVSSGHKGFGLMVAAELFAALAGGLMAGDRREGEWFSNGAIFFFFRHHEICDSPKLARKNASICLLSRIKRVPSAECRVPGAGSAKRERLARRKGIEIADHVVSGVCQLADSLGVQLPVDFMSLEPGLVQSRTKTW